MDSRVPDLPPLLGESPAFLEAMHRVSLAAPLERPVLVIGERGTGKELVAARLHYLAARWDRPFVRLDAAALPESLLESELFGHEAGAFTGALRRRIGRFEQADGGSLFLDEIANIGMAAQEKLLRVVEYGSFERIGGENAISVDVRIIGATNVDLPAEAAAGRFRLDLLDRLAFDVITLPPLRHRAEDIPLLAEHFARGMASDLGWPSYPGLSKATHKALAAYGWPGNLRELKNVVERAVYRWGDPDESVDRIDFDPFASPFRPDTPAIAAAGPLRPEPSAEPGPTFPLDYKKTTAAHEHRLLERALQVNRYNQRATAVDLSLTYDQLRNQLKKHGLMGTSRSGEQ